MVGKKIWAEMGQGKLDNALFNGDLGYMEDANFMTVERPLYGRPRSSCGMVLDL